MKIFIWERISNVTDSYHDGGGLTVIAPSLQEARDLINKELPEDCGALTTDPDHEFTVDSEESKVIVFPDSGCC